MIDRPVWVAIIAKLCSPQDAAAAAKNMMAFLPMLADFPSEAFTPASAEAVARKNRFVPSYAQLREALAEWWRDNRAPQRAIGQAKPDGWNEVDEVWYGYWNKRRGENFAPIPSLSKPPGGMSWKYHVASLVRTHSGKAWSRLTAEGAV